jgi:nucleotide-binding universal stress UspA family protein
MLKRILVGLGGAEYTVSAINQGVALALAHNAELTGISVLDEERLSRVGPLLGASASRARSVAESRISKAKDCVDWASEEFTQACLAASIRFRLLRDEGDPFERMIDQARYHDLMVFGLRSLFEFGVVPDPHHTLAKLVQSGVRPLIAVSKEVRPVNRVLIAYSGSMESATAMKRFIQLRLWPQAKLRIVTFEHEAEKAAMLVGDAAEYCRAHGFEVEEAFNPEAPKHHLIPYAEEWGADRIVVGNSAKNLLLRRMFGETALHVIENAERPLFLAQ